MVPTRKFIDCMNSIKPRIGLINQVLILIERFQHSVKIVGAGVFVVPAPISVERLAACTTGYTHLHAPTGHEIMLYNQVTKDVLGMREYSGLEQDRQLIFEPYLLRSKNQ